MDMPNRKIKKYEQILLGILNETAAFPTSTDTKYVVLTDKVKHFYQLLYFGWENDKQFSHQIIMNFHIQENGKIAVLENKTEIPLDIELLKLGVEMQDIVPLFIPEKERIYWGYGTV